MKLRYAMSCLCVAVCATSLPAHAATTAKPGLWEVTNKMQSSRGDSDKAMAQMQEKLASMPPEQRKMVEEMMAKNGVSMSKSGPGGGITAKVCLTKEMVDRNQWHGQQQGDCTSSHTPTGANSLKITFTCTNPPSQGEGTITFSSDQAYSMKMNMTSTIQGKPEQTQMDASGKWLGSDCGNIKPLAVPAR